MKSSDIIDRFFVRNVDLCCKYLHVLVVVLKNVKAVRDRDFVLNDGEPGGATIKAFFEGYRRRWNVRERNGLCGIIYICRARDIELSALHESMHAAFEISRYGRRWDYNNENQREEFIVSTGEYIFKHIHKRLRSKNLYR